MIEINHSSLKNDQVLLQMIVTLRHISSYATILSDWGENFTGIIKSDLTDVTHLQSKITLIFPQIQKLTQVVVFFSS